MLAVPRAAEHLFASAAALGTPTFAAGAAQCSHGHDGRGACCGGGLAAVVGSATLARWSGEPAGAGVTHGARVGPCAPSVHGRRSECHVAAALATAAGAPRRAAAWRQGGGGSERRLACGPLNGCGARGRRRPWCNGERWRRERWRRERGRRGGRRDGRAMARRRHRGRRRRGCAWRERWEDSARYWGLRGTRQRGASGRVVAAGPLWQRAGRAPADPLARLRLNGAGRRYASTAPALVWAARGDGFHASACAPHAQRPAGRLDMLPAQPAR